LTICVPKTSALRHRDLLLITLGIVTGATDASAFERLGHVFASVITGNLILLGVSAAEGDGTLALFAGSALAAYGVGVLMAAPREDQPPRIWPPSAAYALVVELALLIAFTVGWELAGETPTRGAQVLLVVLAATAMGVQSTAVRRLGQMSTTYLTSTLVGVLEALRRRQWSGENARSVGILLSALSGAAAATALILHARRWMPVLQIVPLMVVLVSSRGLIQRGCASP
jgi:uncharacterized membrane protein YoaK (UPF0700 family)